MGKYATLKYVRKVADQQQEQNAEAIKKNEEILKKIKKEKRKS